MDRRGFMKFLGLGVAGIAVEQAIPLGRVWSFPKEIVVAQPMDEHWIMWSRSEKAYEEAFERWQRTVKVEMGSVPQPWPIIFPGSPPSIERLYDATDARLDLLTNYSEFVNKLPRS